MHPGVTPEFQLRMALTHVWVQLRYIHGSMFYSPEEPFIRPSPGKDRFSHGFIKDIPFERSRC